MTDTDRLEEEVNEATTDIHVQRCIAKGILAAVKRLDYIIVNGITTRVYQPAPVTPPPVQAQAAEEIPQPEGPSFTRVEGEPSEDSKPDDSEHLEISPS
jgi:hypothetical protein